MNSNISLYNKESYTDKNFNRNNSNNSTNSINSNSFTSKSVFAFFTLAVFLFILSFSIALPIIIRPFYYIQIDLLNIQEHSGYSKDTIITAYDEMLDYCLGKSNEFSTGDLAFSPDGKAHFDDVKFLFMLDFSILIISLAVIITLFILIKNKKIPYPLLKNKGALFYGSTLLFILFVAVSIYVLIDFDNAFTSFHNLFFAGKTNWIFDRKKDQIINILPETYFRNCALAALFSILLLITAGIISDRKIKVKTSR